MLGSALYTPLTSVKMSHADAPSAAASATAVVSEPPRPRVVVSPAGDTTTLGRGGSDTTAVALAAALGASACDIFTDVSGVYTADPNSVPSARLLKEMSYE